MHALLVAYAEWNNVFCSLIYNLLGVGVCFRSEKHYYMVRKMRLHSPKNIITRAEKYTDKNFMIGMMSNV